MKLLVFLPCLNEADTLASVICAIPRAFIGISCVDILVVDDGSTDASASVAQEAGAVVISHGSNRGVGAAFRTAVQYALSNGYDFLTNIDADGQFDPNEIALLIQPLLEGKADFVSGSRFLEKTPIEHMSGIKRWGNYRMSALISQLAGRKFYDVSCGFRAYSREALLRLNLQGKFTYTQEVFLNLAFQGLRIQEVPIQVRYFPGRQSRVAGNLVAYAWKTIKIILKTYRDYRAFHFFSLLAVIMWSVGSTLLLFLFTWWWQHGRFTPHIWSGFVGGACMFTGLIFFTLGVMADMFTRLRTHLEELLYLERKKNLE